MQNELALEDLTALQEAADIDDAHKQLQAGDDLGPLLKAYSDTKRRVDELKNFLSEEQKKLEGLNRQLVELFDARGIQNHKIKGVGTFYQRTKAYTSVENNDRLIDWLDEHDEVAIASRSVHHATLTSWYNDRLAAGEEVPPADIVSAFVKSTIAFRKEPNSAK